jgi:hypothetical protein
VARRRRVYLFGIGGDAWQRKYGRQFSAAMGGRLVKPKKKRRRKGRR